MNSKVETPGSRLDPIKLIAAAAVLVGAVGAFYYYSEQSLLVRVLGLLAAVGISTVIALQTELGRSARQYVGDSRAEVRKVVWPTRQETVQTTIVVIVMVIIVGVFLGLLDMFLGWAVRAVTGQGG